MAVLTDNVDPTTYWRKLKQLLKAGGEWNRDELSRVENLSAKQYGYGEEDCIVLH